MPCLNADTEHPATVRKMPEQSFPIQTVERYLRGLIRSPCQQTSEDKTNANHPLQVFHSINKYIRTIASDEVQYWTLVAGI
eukprot:1596870-Amphidinium_carterae.1